MKRNELRKIIIEEIQNILEGYNDDDINIFVPKKLYKAEWSDSQYGYPIDVLFFEVGRKMNRDEIEKILDKKFGIPTYIKESDIKSYNEERKNLNYQLKNIKDKIQNLKVKFN